MCKFGIYSFLLILGAGFLDSAAAAPDSLAWSREQAVEAARKGEFESALKQLAHLREAAPGDMELLYDETVVLSWAGRDKRVVENAALLDSASVPDYVSIEVARSARNAGEFGMAADWYQLLLERNALNLDARRGLAMTLADAGNFASAWQVLDALPNSQMRGTSYYLTEAYVYERQDRLLAALSRYQLAAELDADSRAALRGAALIMRKILLPTEALALARQHPGILTEAEIDNLLADIAAVKLRFGSMAYHPNAERHLGTDAALEMIDELLAEPGLVPSAATRLRYDRIAALNYRQQTADAVREFESLDIDPASVPLYVLMAVSGAYLAERRPEIARDLLEHAIEREPTNFRIQFQLFFAYTELGEAQRALELAETLLASQPKTRRVPGSRVVKANPAYVQAAVLYGLAQAYFDQLAGAQSHLENLLAKAPNNTDVRHELANVYRWRGWLDKSLFEYSQVLTIEPDLIAARVGRAHATLDNQNFAAVELELDLLTQDFKDDPLIRNLTERWRIHNSQEISMALQFGQSSGTTFGSDQYTINAAWYSRPLARNYRILAFTRNDFAEFPEGSLQRDRVGAGIEFRHKRWQATTSLAGLTTGGGLGMRGNLTYRLNDWWRMGAILETNSDETPLRAERFDITSTRTGLNASFRKNEGTEISLSVNRLDFSDSNTATSIYLRTQKQMFNRSSHKVAIKGEFFTERRNRDDVAYFSPRRLASWSVGLGYKWLMERRYDLRLTHEIDAVVGQANQFGFESNETWSIDYNFNAEFSKRLSSNLGFSRRKNSYDGNPEYASFLIGEFRWRF